MSSAVKRRRGSREDEGASPAALSECKRTRGERYRLDDSRLASSGCYRTAPVWSVLPNELWLEVLLWLPRVDLFCRASRVCRRWYALVMSPAVEKIHGESIKWLKYRAGVNSPLTASAHSPWVKCIVVIPAHKLAATGGNDNDGAPIKLWRIPPGSGSGSTSATEGRLSLEAQLTGHTAAVFSLAATPDGDRLFSGSADGSIRAWSLPQGRPIGKLLESQHAVVDLTVSPCGRKLFSVAYHRKEIVVWNATALTRSSVIRVGHTITCIASAADGSFMLGGSVGGVAVILPTLAADSAVAEGVDPDVELGAISPTWRTLGESAAGPVALRPVTALALSSDSRIAVIGTAFGIQLWCRHASRDIEQPWTSMRKLHVASAPKALALTEKGTLLSAHGDGRIAVRERGLDSANEGDTDLPIWIMAHSDAVSALAVCPEGKRVLSASWDGYWSWW